MYDINKSKMTDTDGMTLCATVVNWLEIKGEENRVKEILTAIRGECEIIDYGTMLPCPPVPENEVGEPEREAAAAYLLAANPNSEDFGIEKLSAEDFKKISFAFFDSWGVMPLGESEKFNINAAKYGEKFAEIIKEFGCPTAQDWRRENWGTLVNPVGAEMPDENTIRFFTYYECADKFTKALSETQLSTWLDELRMNPEHLCPAVTITQIEPAELSMLEDCEVSLDALNYLAKRMDGMSSGERKQFFAALTCEELDIGWGMKNIINLTFCLDRFTLIEDTSNLEKVGLTHQLNIRGAISTSELEDREWLVEDGKKLLDSGKGIQTEYGLLFVNREIEFSDIFNGTTFPGYFCDPDAIATVGIFYRGITEYAELLCEDIAIKKAICRLGAENIKDCKLEADSSRDISDEWMTKICSVENTKDIFGLNSLLKSDEVRKMLEPESLFNKEVSRVLRKNGFTVSENSGCINVYGDGIIQAKIFDSETISAPRSNSGEAYFKIKDIARTISEYCSAYEKAPVLKAESLSGIYLESFESAATRIRDPKCTRKINDNLTNCDPEDDEDFEEECSETEQGEDEEITESESDPDEDFQLKLF